MPNTGLGAGERENREYLHNRVRQHFGGAKFGSRRDQKEGFRRHLKETGRKVGFRELRAEHRKAQKSRPSYGVNHAEMKRQKSAEFKAEQKKSKRSRRRGKNAVKKGSFKKTG